MENEKPESQANQLKCLICGHERFTRREVKLDLGAPTPGFQTSQTTAFCVVCEKCGYVHWFFPTSNRGAA